MKCMREKRNSNWCFEQQKVILLLVLALAIRKIPWSRLRMKKTVRFILIVGFICSCKWENRTNPVYCIVQQSSKYPVSCFSKSCQVFYFYVLDLHLFNLFWMCYWLLLLWDNGKRNSLACFHLLLHMCCFCKCIVDLTKLKESWMPSVKFTKLLGM